jgi:hypothetical protein|tara:strand:- start:806 stop:1249 length:444 start_codon:yes stop_codon:yes gene_type:complete
MNEYAEVVSALENVFLLMPKGVSLAKGGVGELAMAYELGHTLVAGDKGADGTDSEGLLYEYKVSETNTFNFHHGTRQPTWEATKARIEKHWENIDGAWVGERVGMRITDKHYVPTSILLPFLLEYFERTKGSQLNRSISMKKFKEIV